LIENRNAQDSQYDLGISKHDHDLVKSTWNLIKKNGNIAPKAFLRYFKLKPHHQQMFPAFANVPLVDLPTNINFLHQAFTCVSSLSTHIDRLGKNPKSCPYLSSNKSNIDAKVVKEFGKVLIAVVEEELGDKFSADVKKIFRNLLNTTHAELIRA